jgi:hypothetical protein
MLAILQASSDADALAQVGISAAGGPVSRVTLGPGGNATSANVSSLSAALGPTGARQPVLTDAGCLSSLT